MSSARGGTIEGSACSGYRARGGHSSEFGYGSHTRSLASMNPLLLPPEPPGCQPERDPPRDRRRHRPHRYAARTLTHLVGSSSCLGAAGSSGSRSQLRPAKPEACRCGPLEEAHSPPLKIRAANTLLFFPHEVPGPVIPAEPVLDLIGERKSSRLPRIPVRVSLSWSDEATCHVAVQLGKSPGIAVVLPYSWLSHAPRILRLSG